MKGTCENCGRARHIISHHIRPRVVGGTDCGSNRMSLCVSCERFLHASFDHSDLAHLGRNILKDEKVKAYGKFVDTPFYKRRAPMRKNIYDFEKWLVKVAKK